MALRNTQLHIYGLPRIVHRIKPRADTARCDRQSVCKPFLLTKAFSAKLRMIVFSSVSYEAHVYWFRRVLNTRCGFCLSRDTHTHIYTDFPEDYCNPRRLGLISSELKLHRQSAKCACAYRSEPSFHNR